MKKFTEIKNMLEKKGLLSSSIQKGESYDVDGFRFMRVQGDFQHMMLVVRDEFYQDCISYMIGKGSLSEAQYLKFLERSYSTMPLQVLIVTDLDAAEEAVKEFLR